MGHAVRLLADSDTFGAVEGGASLVRALDLALRLLALDVTYCVLGLGAGGVASRRLTHRLADSGALWVIALPGAFWVAFCCFCRERKS